jgi:hypothetical protein
LSLEQAIALGREYFGGPEDRVARFLETLVSVNEEFVQYALARSGERIGYTSAYAITDDAYEATLRGERGTFEHQPGEIVPSSNNIVLNCFVEFHNAGQHMRNFSKRLAVQSSFLSQIARLLDPTVRRPIRCVTYTIAPDNNKRLYRLGFQDVKGSDGKTLVLKGEYNCNYSVVEFDPTTRPFVRRCLMMLLDDFIWRIRTSYDQAT